MRDLAARIAAARGRVKEMDEDASPTVGIAKEEIAKAEGIEATYFKPKKLEVPLKFTVVGGSGWTFTTEKSYTLNIASTCLKFTGDEPDGEITVQFDELTAVEISGGSQTTNMGLVGGGFGLAGAADGIALAALVNALTTRTVTNTYVRLASKDAEVFLHTDQLDSAPLRLLLSPAVVRMEARRMSPTRTSLADELEKLHRLFQSGVLSDQEYAVAKARVLSDRNL